jgi:2-polyprenyl-3-methyl-5-hydroxy-6-metoxy-1,4-benzoquinol methylase
MSRIADFWNDVYTKTQPSLALDPETQKAVDAALEHFGDVRGRTILDFGCGTGATSLYFARIGANVIAADISEVAIESLAREARETGLSNLQPRLISAPFMGGIDGFDFIFGNFILHHLEPVEQFASELHDKLRLKGFFWENNAASRLFVWLRNHAAGRLWIPKYGDDIESPLTPDELEVLRKYFTVEVEYPEMYFWRLVSGYILGDRLYSLAVALDEFFYRHNILTRYSYRQFIRLTVPAANR